MKPMTSLLSQAVFAKGIAILRACVRGLEADDKTVKVWYELLRCEVSDRTYTEAVKMICKSTTNIYPGTNIVAMILETADKVRMEQPAPVLQLEEGYTEEQFEKGRKKLKLIFESLSRIKSTV